ncbi:hypothetical protein MMC28_005379 [Mycoblastus sanguinarius]|nr:hypothetical protein [Mycoblastus sanguinarius]
MAHRRTNLMPDLVQDDPHTTPVFQTMDHQPINLVPNLAATEGQSVKPHALSRWPPSNYVCLYPHCGALFSTTDRLDLHITTHFEGPSHGNNIFHEHRQSRLDTIDAVSHPMSQGIVVTGARSHALSGDYGSYNPATSTTNGDQGAPTCAQCNKSFTRLSDLERHAKGHEAGPKEFQCPVGGCEYKGSYRKDKLAVHMRSCHNIVVQRSRRT